MDKKQISQQYIKKSDENFELYEFLSIENKFLEWQAVSIFYSALCHVKAYLYSKPSMPKDSINSHKDIKWWLLNEGVASRLMIYENYYNFLYNYSRDARYKCGKITQQVIDKMLEKHEQVKSLLKIK